MHLTLEQKQERIESALWTLANSAGPQVQFESLRLLTDLLRISLEERKLFMGSDKPNPGDL